MFAETIDMDTATSLEQEEAKLCILDLGLILTISHAFHSAVPHRTRRVVRSFSFFSPRPWVSDADWCIQSDVMLDSRL